MARRHLPLAAALLAAAAWLAPAACGENGMVHVPPPPAPVGSARVTWTIVDGMGTPLTCEDLGAERAQVLVGGKEVFVGCADAPEAIFDNLTAGRYPVIVRLLRLGTAVILERAANVIVPAGARGEISVEFVYDPTAGTTGNLLVRWRINDSPASTGCALVGGSTVEITDLPGGGSLRPFATVAPCTAGQVTFTDLPAGGYAVLLKLRNEANETFVTASILAVTVPNGATAMPTEVSFSTSSNVELSALYATWTVNGTVASSGCAALAADAVIIRAFSDIPAAPPTVTATAACDSGMVRVEDVPPGSRRHRVVFLLYSGYFTDPPIPIQLTSTTARDIVFVRGETATVSVDLDTPE